MPRAFTEHERDLIGRRLQEQGFKLFSAYGLKKTNIEEIARATGISKGAFYGFYESKEALFMDVVEQAEARGRLEILATIDLPGPSPRARLFAVLKKAMALFEAVPILQWLTVGDYDLLFRSIPAEQLQQHLNSDRVFFEELITRCRNAGIPIQARPEQIGGLLYPLVLLIFQRGEWNRIAPSGNIDLFLELIAAYCLGEVQLKCQEPDSSLASAEKGTQHEPVH